MNCYICLQHIENPQKFCKCDPMKYPAHENCIMVWLNNSTHRTCAICSGIYKIDTDYEIPMDYEHEEIRRCLTFHFREAAQRLFTAYATNNPSVHVIHDERTLTESIPIRRIIYPRHSYKPIDTTLELSFTFMRHPTHVHFMYMINLDMNINLKIPLFINQRIPGPGYICGIMKSRFPIDNVGFPYDTIRRIHYDQVIQTTRNMIHSAITKRMKTLKRRGSAYISDNLSIKRTRHYTYTVTIRKHVHAIPIPWPFRVSYVPKEIEGYDMNWRDDPLSDDTLEITYIKDCFMGRLIRYVS